MRVLIIEPDGGTRRGLELMMTNDGFSVYTTDLGEEGIDLAKTYDYDAVVSEITLPDMTGLALIRALRLAKITTPLVMLTAQADIDTKVRAYTAGADDFLAKPFHRDELIARLRAVIRRSHGMAVSVLTVGAITLDLNSKMAMVEGRPIHLTPREYQMVELLMLRRGSVITKEAFLNHMYGGLDEPELKIVDVYLCKIRNKLGDHWAHVQTVWGRGYRFVEDASPTMRSSLFKSTRGAAHAIVKACAKAPSSFLELRVVSPDTKPTTLRTIISHHLELGILVNNGSHGAALYEVTPAGKTWLAAQSPKVAA